MLSLHRGTKLCAAIVVAAIMLAGALSWSYAETGSVRLNIVKAGFIVGIGGGSGTLNFQGRDYQLSIGGINVGTIGASAVELVGTAENLRTARALQRLRSWVAEESQNCRMRTAWF